MPASAAPVQQRALEPQVDRLLTPHTPKRGRPDARPTFRRVPTGPDQPRQWCMCSRQAAMTLMARLVASRGGFVCVRRAVRAWLTGKTVDRTRPPSSAILFAASAQEATALRVPKRSRRAHHLPVPYRRVPVADDHLLSRNARARRCHVELSTSAPRRSREACRRSTPVSRARTSLRGAVKRDQS